MLTIAAARLVLPDERDTAASAIEQGRADRDDVERDGYTGLPVSSGRSAPELAVQAGALALADAGLTGASLGLLAHAWVYYQGHDFWSPAHYVAARLGALGAVPVGVQQMCNGGAAAMQIAADRMAADAALTAAMVTTGDCFPGPAFDRWRGDYAMAYGDSATAVLLTRDPGPYCLLGQAVAAAPELEWMHRGDDQFASYPLEQSPRIDIRRTKKAFLAAGGGPQFAAAAREAVRGLITRVLDEAGVGPHDRRLRLLALPRLGLSVLDQAYLPALAGLTGAEFLDLGRDTGHLGAGDAAGNLADIAARRLLAPGEYALLLSAGAGFTWSALLVRANLFSFRSTSKGSLY
jgi:3-oxoacyl-[acyl-carrier-protein] synthase III